MELRAVLEVLDALAAASVFVFLDGGWGVDALLGEQTRTHADLDLIVGASEGEKLRDALGRLGFRQKSGDSETNFVLAGKGHRRPSGNLKDP